MHTRTLDFYQRKNIHPKTAPGLDSILRIRIGGSFGILLFLVVLAGAYIFSINSNAVQGYRIRHLEQSIADMQEENARLQILAADAKSFQHIEDMSGILALESANAPQYFEERDIVAVR